MAKGIIYIMTTSVNGLIKIGKTDNFKNRMQILEQNGYWNVSGLKRFYAVRVNDYDKKEKLIHTMFSKSQVSNSELFALDKQIAKELLESFDGEQIYPEINTSKPNPKAKKSKKTAPTEKSRVSRLFLKDIGIPKGATLSYVDDPSITCTVVDAAKNIVEYNGSKFSLSGFVKFLKNDGQQYRGSLHLMYKGKRLTQIREEKGV